MTILKHMGLTCATLAACLLLALPGYFSEWWPPWAQIMCLFIGVVIVAVGFSALSWKLWGEHTEDNCGGRS